ncbi:MAG: DUF2125 domain-containing protein, partial [Alphaproteobacteria bacterium]|nr:DUF2125 domain-containing protein [Alphaproteobacteria bacterium]
MKRLFPFLPLAAFLLLIALYSLIWTKTARIASAELGAFLASMDHAGQSLSVRQPSAHGYPFRLQYELGPVRMEGGLIGPASLAIPDLRVNLLPYSTEHRIFTAPSGLTLEGGTPFRARTARASLVDEDGLPARLSVDMEEVRLGEARAARAIVHLFGLHQAAPSLHLRLVETALPDGTALPQIEAWLGPQSPGLSGGPGGAGLLRLPGEDQPRDYRLQAEEADGLGRPTVGAAADGSVLAPALGTAIERMLQGPSGGPLILEEGQLVRVVLHYTLGPQSLDGCYQVSD